MNELVSEIDGCEVVERDNLAVVYRVERLEPIQGKDRVELVHMHDNGFTAVAEKGLRVNDVVLFVKYDSVVPDTELFSFMKESKFRIKPKSFTIKDGEETIGKIYSQGIIIPVYSAIFCNWYESKYNMPAIELYDLVGTDLTIDLGVVKYIPPVMRGAGAGFGEMRSKGSFPTHILSKTDEINLASKIKLLNEINGKSVYITQKIEGSSVSAFRDPAVDELNVCSRNTMLSETDTCKFWIAANKYNLSESLREYPWMALQGELYGSGIQKNKLGVDGVDMFVFNMIDTRNRRRLGLDEMLEYREKLNVPIVPILIKIDSFDWTYDQLQEFADKQTYANGSPAEGIVVRPTEPFFSSILKEDFSCKVINREYRL